VTFKIAVFPDRTKAGAADENSRIPANKRRVRKRRSYALATLIFVGVVLGVIVAEAAIRLFGIGRPVFYTYSPMRGWKLRAGSAAWQTNEGHAFVSLNRWGYRGTDWTRVKPSGTLRVAVLGDSFIEAQQVAEPATACELIQRLLTQMLPRLARGRYLGLKRVEVMNFGVDGYGTAQEFFTLTEDVWQFSPDIVVLAFFPGNDVRNNSALLEGDKCRPFFVPQGTEVVLGGPFVDSRLFHFECFLRFESYRSQLLNVLGEARSALRIVRRKRLLRVGAQPLLHRSAGVSTKGLDEPGISDTIYRPPIKQEWRDAWNVSEAEIVMTEQNVHAHYALFLLVIVSTGIQLAPSPAFQAGYLRAVGATDLLYPSHRLTALGAEKGFAVLDLVPPMKSYAQDHRVFFHGFSNTAMGTGHWNERGNCFAASLIANKLAAMMAQSQGP
jgi:hypothetical protein